MSWILNPPKVFEKATALKTLNPQPTPTSRADLQLSRLSPTGHGPEALQGLSQLPPVFLAAWVEARHLREARRGL